VRSAIDSTKCVDTCARSLPVLARVELQIDAEAKTGLDQGIGHLASMSPQKNERLNPNKG